MFVLQQDRRHKQRGSWRGWFHSSPLHLFANCASRSRYCTPADQLSLLSYLMLFYTEEICDLRILAILWNELVDVSTYAFVTMSSGVQILSTGRINLSNAYTDVSQANSGSSHSCVFKSKLMLSKNNIFYFFLLFFMWKYFEAYHWGVQKNY